MAWFCSVLFCSCRFFASLLLWFWFQFILSFFLSMFTIHRQNKYTYVLIKRQTQWLWNHYCYFEKKPYVWKKRDWDIFIGIKFMFSKRLPAYSFRSFYLLFALCLSFFVLLLCLRFTFHPFKRFSAADDYQLTHTDWLAFYTCAKLHWIQLIVCLWLNLRERNRFFVAKKRTPENPNSQLKFWASSPKKKTHTMQNETCSILVPCKQKR